MKKSLLALLAAVTAGFCTSLTQAAPIQWSGNGHWYERIDTPINWADARAEAAAKGGYLVTVTSAAENLFLTSTEGLGLANSNGDLLHYHWLGGYEDPDNGIDDPVANWNWVTGELFSYFNWASPGEPNGGISEYTIVFDHGFSVDGKQWNDLDGQVTVDGYVVEYDQLSVPDAGLMLPGLLVAWGTMLAATRRRRR